MEPQLCLLRGSAEQAPTRSHPTHSAKSKIDSESRFPMRMSIDQYMKKLKKMDFPLYFQISNRRGQIHFLDIDP